MRRLLAASALVLLVTALAAAPAVACGGLVAPNGTVRLLRTSTLAAYHAGVEHYITSFTFTGGGAEVGSIVPLPGVPTKVERGGDWTLQRLQRETQPVFEAAAASTDAGARTTSAKVLLETRIDALDLTVLEGGAAEVGRWATEHGFALSPDAPEVLEFYAARSPIFLAARFDAKAAAARQQGVGDGTPVHLTIPTDRPWVPLRILALGRGEAEPVEADVYLLTDRQPDLLGLTGLREERSEPASAALLQDLRFDKGMQWVPYSMWLTHLRVDAPARVLDHDLAISVDERSPSSVDAGYSLISSTEPIDEHGRPPLWPFVLVTALVGAASVPLLRRRWG
ncbi:MAG TPA: DUF2330 domain-containing protein [Acidimicrobiales bacterium]|nr:DUF2330 domain-containing protein [Acidimicrobiales bacterium]